MATTPTLPPADRADDWQRARALVDEIWFNVRGLNEHYSDDGPWLDALLTRGQAAERERDAARAEAATIALVVEAAIAYVECWHDQTRSCREAGDVLFNAAHALRRARLAQER